MALSGSTNYNLTAGSLINAILKQLGIGLNSETPTAEETNDVLLHLNLFLKENSVHGLKTWLRKTEAITMVASTASYTLGPTGTVVMDRPNAIIDAYIRDENDYDRPLTSLSQEEYIHLPDKTLTSTDVIQYHYDPQLTNGVLYLFPVPNSTAATNDTLYIVYTKPIDDLDATTDDIEIPVEWYNAALWNVADVMAISYDVPESRHNKITQKASISLAKAQSSDLEFNTSVTFHKRSR